MKNKILKISAAALMGAALVVPTSCSDLIDQQPIDWYGFDNFWKTTNDYTGNAIADMQMFRANYAMNILFWAGELRSGSLTNNFLMTSSGYDFGQLSYINNDYTVAQPQFNNFMNFPGFIANLNELIYKANTASDGILTDAQRDGMLAWAYGMRAYAYFQIYKMWGGAVIRTEPEVQLGERDPQVLYKERSTPQETLDLIKSDIQQSETLFASSGMNYPMNALVGQPNDYFWNAAATQMLKGEVYLWSAKVATGDHALGGASDVAVAKQAFLNVVNNYNYSLYPNYKALWTAPHNSESIFAICYSNETDGAYASGVAAQLLWRPSLGGPSQATWTVQGPSGLDKVAWDAETETFVNASRFGYYSTDPTSQGTQYTSWTNFDPSPNRYMWKNAMYYQYDPIDTRTYMWLPQWYVLESEDGDAEAGIAPIYSIANFNPTQYDLMGTFTIKMTPGTVTTSTYLQFNNDQFIYRLALAYTYLAEIANYEGNYGEIAQWINPIIERAYGANWDESKYGFKATSDFAENEAMILREKNKEFVMEGQRWWDLRRMTTMKDGAQTAHMVFQPQGCIGYGLDVVSNPWMLEAGGQGSQSLVETQTPVLSTSEEYKLLWPINQALMDSDPQVLQNPGYGGNEVKW